MTTRGIRSAVVVLLAGVAAVGCVEASAGPTLSGTHGSPEALARAALDAIAEGDREALRSLRVPRDEYREILWPELPESDDMPFALAWQMNDANSRKGMNAVFGVLEGQRFELLELRFDDEKEPERYETFTVHFGAEMVVRRTSDGREGTIELLDVLVERNGRWKAMNFDEG